MLKLRSMQITKQMFKKKTEYERQLSVTAVQKIVVEETGTCGSEASKEAAQNNLGEKDLQLGPEWG